jgi:hypothetical protein
MQKAEIIGKAIKGDDTRLIDIMDKIAYDAEARKQYLRYFHIIKTKELNASLKMGIGTLSQEEQKLLESIDYDGNKEDLITRIQTQIIDENIDKKIAHWEGVLSTKKADDIHNGKTREQIEMLRNLKIYVAQRLTKMLGRLVPSVKTVATTQQQSPPANKIDVSTPQQEQNNTLQYKIFNTPVPNAEVNTKPATPDAAALNANSQPAKPNDVTPKSNNTAPVVASAEPVKNDEKSETKNAEQSAAKSTEEIEIKTKELTFFNHIAIFVYQILARLSNFFGFSAEAKKYRKKIDDIKYVQPKTEKKLPSVAKDSTKKDEKKVKDLQPATKTAQREQTHEGMSS